MAAQAGSRAAAPRSAIVVGGGVAGLLAADELLRGGVAVTVLEASDRFGGIVRSERHGDLLLELGPDSIHTARPAAARLIERLGLADRTVAGLPGGASIVWKDRLYPIPPGTVLGIPTSLRSVARSRLFRRAHALSMALDFVARPGVEEDVPVGHLIRRRLGKAAADRLVGPLLGGISGTDIDELSAAAAFPEFLDWEREHGSLIRGARAAAQRRSGEAPFVSLPGGMGELVEVLVARLAGARLVAGEGVERIERSASGWSATTTAGRHDAELIVLAVSPTVAADLARDLAPAAAPPLEGIAMRPAVLVHLAYDAATPARDPGHGFVVARSELRPTAAVTVASAKWPGRATPGTMLLRASAHPDLTGPDGPSDVELTRMIVADVRSILGLESRPTFSSVHRIAEAQAVRALGHLDRVASARRELARAGSIALVGGAYDGPGIPSILDGVEREVGHILVAPAA